MTLSWIKRIYWNCLSKISIQSATVKDISDMIYMDAKRFPPGWCVEESWAREIFFSNCSEYYVYRKKGRVIAYYVLIYVNKSAFLELMYNRISEDMLVSHLDMKDKCVYILSVNSLPNTSKSITRQLLIHMNKRVSELREQQYDLVSIAISKDGERVLNRLGFKPFYVDLQNDVVVFSAQMV
jgi:hypothetical protein